jgi:hypothetical protein
MSTTPPVRISLFTLDPSQTGGRKARAGFEIQDQYIACILSGFLAGDEDLLTARIEAVEDLDVIVRVETGWVERYYQIKSRQEGGKRWTIAALHKEGVWVRFFSLHRLFLLQQTERSKRAEFVIAVEGDLDADLIELRNSGPAAVQPRAKLLSLLVEGVAQEKLPAGPDAETYVNSLLDNFIATLRFQSRVGHLREIALAKLFSSGDLSPDEANRAFDRLLSSIREESIRPQPTFITPSNLRDWLGSPERAILQKKPVAEPYEVRRNGLITDLGEILENAGAVLLYGTPKIGKSHLVSSLIDHLNKSDAYFWFTFSGDTRDKDSLAFQLASWAGQRTSVWQIKDDIQRGHLLPDEALSRLQNVSIGDVCLVLDDCHKANDRGFLDALLDLARNGWTHATVIFVSEEKIPELVASGVKDHRVTGFEPKEGIRFLLNLGIDVRDALAELGILCVQADGHPALLRAIATELSARPSSSEVTTLCGSLTNAKAAQPFLQVLSERLVGSLKTEAHHRWLARLAVLAFSFRRDLGMEIARLEPAIDVSLADWNFLVSHIFDQTSADQYVVPILLRPLLRRPQALPDENTVLAASARYIFRTARASNRIDFWDFHSAIIALIAAQRFEEAAYHFIVSMVPTKQSIPFSAVELLFLILNGEPIHQGLDAATRFTLLLMEVNMRLLDDSPPDYTKVLDLMRRMRLVQRQESSARRTYAGLMLRMSVVLARLRRIKDSTAAPPRAERRVFASIEATLRSSLSQDDSNLISQVLVLYGGLHFLARRPDLELLKRAILSSRKGAMGISGAALIDLYARSAINQKDDQEAVALFERHSSEYRAGGHAEAFFAAEHGIATVLVERRDADADARCRVTEAAREGAALGASADVLGRADLLIADTYWNEKAYGTSTEFYHKALNYDFGDETLNQWARERAADSLIFSRDFEKAALQLIHILTKNHLRLLPLHKARLYARLAYSYAEGNSLRKASIACLGLRRIAEVSASAEIDRLSVVVSGWVLQHLSYSDQGIPTSDVKIRDSSGLSEAPSAEQMDVWIKSGPPLVRGLMIVGSLFELLGQFLRSDYLYRKALTTLELSSGYEETKEGKYFFRLRIARIDIRRRRFADAAETFRIAVEELLGSKQKPNNLTPWGGAYVALSLVEPCLEACSDSEVMDCFKEFCKKYTTECPIRAGLLLKESDFLFSRFMVQAACQKLLEAESLVLACDDQELIWSIIYNKLFTRMEQMYRNQVNWLADVLQGSLTLSRREGLAAKRQDFGKAIFALAKRYVSPMQDIAQNIDRFGARWKDDPFIFSTLATWKVAKQYRPAMAHLGEVEDMLRKRGALSLADFE